MLCCSNCTDKVGGSSKQRPHTMCLPGGDFDLAFSTISVKRSWDLICCFWLVRSFLSLLCEALIWFVWIAKWNDWPDLLHHKDASWHTQAWGLIESTQGCKTALAVEWDLTRKRSTQSLLWEKWTKLLFWVSLSSHTVDSNIRLMLLLKTVAKAFPAGCLLEIPSPKAFDRHIKTILLTLLLIFQSWKWISWLWAAGNCAHICMCLPPELPGGRWISLAQRGEQFSPAWLRADGCFRGTNPGCAIHTASDLRLIYMSKTDRILR